MKKLLLTAIVLLACITANAQDTIRINRKQIVEVIPEYRTTTEPTYWAIVEVKGKRYVAKVTKTELKRMEADPTRACAIIELKSYTKVIVL